MLDSSLAGDPFALFPIQAVGMENGVYLFVEHCNCHALLTIGFPNHAVSTSAVFHGSLVRNSTPIPPRLFPKTHAPTGERLAGAIVLFAISTLRELSSGSQDGMKLLELEAMGLGYR
jgi:hypothetical protein